MRWWLGAVVVVGCGRIGIDPRADGTADVSPDAPPNPATTFLVAAHVGNSCAIIAGALSCWGANASGQLATGDTMDRFAPTPIGTDTDWIAVMPGQDHICGVRGTGDLYCWGGNTRGQLGTGDFNPRTSPTLVPLPAGVAALDAYFHTCAALVDGSLYCWGRNDEGELAQNDMNGAPDIPSPVAMGSFDLASTGQGHTLAVGKGVLYGTGRNTDGELGLGATGPAQERVMTMIDAGPWRIITAGQSSSCGLRTDGSVACWGGNDLYQLGTGDMTMRTTPTTTLTGQISVDFDTFHGCALSPAHQLTCWGRNVEGQLGTGNRNTPLPPTPTSTYDDWIQIATGRFHTCGMRADHSVWCAGGNTTGALGVSGPMSSADFLRAL